MTTFTRAGLAQAGFGGFVSVEALRTDPSAIPRAPGVYVVLAREAGSGDFLAASTGGRFKGKDPAVPTGTLRAKWLDETAVLYIGKATSLRSRVGQLVRFGAGSPVGHWGGRYLWQVNGSGDFLIGWRLADAPRDTEMAMLAAFEEQFGALPFANLAR